MRRISAIEIAATSAASGGKAEKDFLVSFLRSKYREGEAPAEPLSRCVNLLRGSCRTVKSMRVPTSRLSGSFALPACVLRRLWHQRKKCSNALTIGPLIMLALIAGCDRRDMYDQPRYEPLEASNFFRDGLSARPRVEGTIPRGGLREDAAFYTGKESGKLVSRIPDAAYRATYARNPQRFAQSYRETKQSKLRLALLERGQERFEIHCSVCHDHTGSGNGMVVRRGFRKPPSYHIERLRQVPGGHLFDVISNGFGAMAPYASRIDVEDRWAIVAYIRALQLSQNAPFEDVPSAHRDDLAPQQRDRDDTPVFTGESQR